MLKVDIAPPSGAMSNIQTHHLLAVCNACYLYVEDICDLDQKYMLSVIYMCVLVYIQILMPMM